MHVTDRADAGRKGAADGRRRHVAHRCHRPRSASRRCDDRRPERGARRPLVERHLGLLPVRHGAGRDLEPRPGAPVGRVAGSTRPPARAPRSCSRPRSTSTATRSPAATSSASPKTRYLTARAGGRVHRRRPERGVAAAVKHFVCNDQEHERNTISVERRRAHAARDLPAAVRGGGATRRASGRVMSAYNRLDGTYCSRARRPADRAAARRVGLRRPGRLRLVRHAQRRRRRPPAWTWRCPARPTSSATTSNRAGQQRRHPRGGPGPRRRRPRRLDRAHHEHRERRLSRVANARDVAEQRRPKRSCCCATMASCR